MTLAASVSTMEMAGPSVFGRVETEGSPTLGRGRHGRLRVLVPDAIRWGISRRARLEAETTMPFTAIACAATCRLGGARRGQRGRVREGGLVITTARGSVITSPPIGRGLQPVADLGRCNAMPAENQETLGGSYGLLRAIG